VPHQQDSPCDRVEREVASRTLSTLSKVVLSSQMHSEFHIRPATLDDIPGLQVLIPLSARNLRQGYSSEQVEAALGSALGVDTQLVRDGTYFVVEAGSDLVACGGWSRRRTLYGSDHVHATAKDDSWLDPKREPARIRAFFVHPEYARRGIGSLLLRTCEEAAARLGFTDLELASTLPGEPLYRAHGYAEVERFEVPLPTGKGLPVIRMRKTLRSAEVAK
jgi:GNAT superfamily N-acetyltransferase